MGEVIGAGGVIVAERPELGEGLRLLVIRRDETYGLPKGTVERELDGGWRRETVTSAARREVGEETGHQVEITGFAGIVDYAANRYSDGQKVGEVDKTVVFFFMKIVGEVGMPEPEGELCWVTYEDAIAGIQYPEVAEFLQGILPLVGVARNENAMANDRQARQAVGKHYAN